jgi:hypothetical protein
MNTMIAALISAGTIAGLYSAPVAFADMTTGRYLNMLLVNGVGYSSRTAIVKTGNSICAAFRDGRSLAIIVQKGTQ